MKKSLILIGGRGPEKMGPLDASSYSRIIAADSGYDLSLTLGLEVDLVVGDLDSTGYRQEVLSRNLLLSPEDKDETDFDLALMRLEEGESYDLIGGGEGRLDHIVSIFSSFCNYGPPGIWLTREDVLVSFRKASLLAPVGTHISFFPTRLDRYGRVTTKGLFWDLEDHELGLSFTSLSNRFREEKVEIECTETLFARFDSTIGLSISKEDGIIRIC